MNLKNDYAMIFRSLSNVTVLIGKRLTLNLVKLPRVIT